jgi:hypothetical protein
MKPPLKKGENHESSPMRKVRRQNVFVAPRASSNDGTPSRDPDVSMCELRASAGTRGRSQFSGHKVTSNPKHLRVLKFEKASKRLLEFFNDLQAENWSDVPVIRIAECSLTRRIAKLPFRASM